VRSMRTGYQPSFQRNPEYSSRYEVARVFFLCSGYMQGSGAEVRNWVVHHCFLGGPREPLFCKYRNCFVFYGAELLS
jgi:hypothetical protein